MNANVIDLIERCRHLVSTDDGPLQGRAHQVGVEVLPYDWPGAP